MSVDDFRALALSMPEATEGEHMGHPDFRVGRKIFASLGYPDQSRATVMLPSDEQARLVAKCSDIFQPSVGAWGKSGATQVLLAHADGTTVESALAVAWLKRAPKRLAKKYAGG